MAFVLCQEPGGHHRDASAVKPNGSLVHFQSKIISSSLQNDLAYHNAGVVA
jgi:hypothetical protein